MCRNDAAGEEVLRDHQGKSLLSEKDETQEIGTGLVFHLLQTWSSPSTGGYHKGCQRWKVCCDSVGQPCCRTWRREDKGLVSEPQQPGNNFQDRGLAYLGTPS